MSKDCGNGSCANRSRFLGQPKQLASDKSDALVLAALQSNITAINVELKELNKNTKKSAESLDQIAKPQTGAERQADLLIILTAAVVIVGVIQIIILWYK